MFIKGLAYRRSVECQHKTCNLFFWLNSMNKFSTFIACFQFKLFPEWTKRKEFHIFYINQVEKRRKKKKTGEYPLNCCSHKDGSNAFIFFSNYEQNNSKRKNRILITPPDNGTNIIRSGITFSVAWQCNGNWQHVGIMRRNCKFHLKLNKHCAASYSFYWMKQLFLLPCASYAHSPAYPAFTSILLFIKCTFN